MSDTTDPYVIVTKEEAELMTFAKHISAQEVEDLIERGDLFIKHLEKSKMAYMLQLALGGYKGKETELYRSCDTIDELIEGMKKLPKTYKNFLKKKQDKADGKKYSELVDIEEEIKPTENKEDGLLNI